MTLESVVKEEIKKLVKALKPLYVEAFIQGTKDAGLTVGKSILRKDIYDEAVNYYYEQNDWIMSHFEDVDIDLLNEHLAIAVTEGQSFSQFWSGVQNTGMFGYDRARRIFRTETARAYNEGCLRQYAKEGVEKINVRLGPNPCPVCVELAQAGPYKVEEAYGIWPTHPNCSCVLVNAKYLDTPGSNGRVGADNYVWDIDNKTYNAVYQTAKNTISKIDKNAFLQASYRDKINMLGDTYKKCYEILPKNTVNAGQHVLSEWGNNSSYGRGLIIKGIASRKFKTLSLFSKNVGYVDSNKALMEKLSNEISAMNNAIGREGYTISEVSKFFDVEYIINQEIIKRLHDGKISVFRGVKSDVIKINDLLLHEHDKFNGKMQQDSASSWSINENVAKNFGSYKISYKTDGSKVLSSYYNGNLLSHEQEFIIGGGKLDVGVEIIPSQYL